MYRYDYFLFSVLCFFLFALSAHWREQQSTKFIPSAALGRVVISSPVLIALHGGDRFLAANFEVVRLAATGVDGGLVDAGYLVRAQRVVSELNPCHEDNYYLANGLLSWGGAVAVGNEILRRASDCRQWDGMPDFFYGINLSFFERDIDGAVQALNRSAERWPENSSSLRKLAVMLQVEEYADERLALAYLTRQRDEAKDTKLREMLDRRVVRLQGLVSLRAAQRRYEKRHGYLVDISQLVQAGELAVIPDDPLRLGYELIDGRIELRKLKIVGLEGAP